MGDAGIEMHSNEKNRFSLVLKFYFKKGILEQKRCYIDLNCVYLHCTIYGKFSVVSYSLIFSRQIYHKFCCCCSRACI